MGRPKITCWCLSRKKKCELPVGHQPLVKYLYLQVCWEDQFLFVCLFVLDLGWCSEEHWTSDQLNAAGHTINSRWVYKSLNSSLHHQQVLKDSGEAWGRRRRTEDYGGPGGLFIVPWNKTSTKTKCEINPWHVWFLSFILVLLCGCFVLHYFCLFHSFWFKLTFLWLSHYSPRHLFPAPLTLPLISAHFSFFCLLFTKLPPLCWFLPLFPLFLSFFMVLPPQIRFLHMFYLLLLLYLFLSLPGCFFQHLWYNFMFGEERNKCTWASSSETQPTFVCSVLETKLIWMEEISFCNLDLQPLDAEDAWTSEHAVSWIFTQIHMFRLMQRRADRAEAKAGSCSKQRTLQTSNRLQSQPHRTFLRYRDGNSFFFVSAMRWRNHKNLLRNFRPSLHPSRIAC